MIKWFSSRVAVVAICFVCIVSLGPLLMAPLLFDDTSIVGKDPFIAAFVAGRAEPADATRDLWFQPRPVRLLSHRLDAIAFRGGLVGPHALNLALHVAVGLLFFSLLRKIGVPDGTRLAALALFLLHPVCVESVGILSHRKELLAALFLLGALRLSLSERRAFRLLAAPVLFLAVFSKETAAVFPVLWLLVARERSRRAGVAFRFRGAAFCSLAAWTAVSGILAALAWLQIRHGMSVLHAAPGLDPDRAGHFADGTPWGLACSAALRAFPRYLTGFLVPWGHSIDPAFALDVPALSLWTLAAIAVWAACLALLAWLWRQGSRLFAPLAWMALSLSPYLLPPLLRSGGTAAFCDRYAYLSCMGVGWFLAEALPAAARRAGLHGRLIAAPIVLLAFLYAGCSWAEADDFRSPQAFWGRACRWNPRSFQASNNLAYALWKEEGDRVGARREFERMRALHPGFSFGMANYADFLTSLRETDGALAVLDEGLCNRPDDRRLLGRRARTLLECRRYREALAAFRAAEAAGVNSPDFQFDYAEACKRNLLWPEAWSRYRRAASSDPTFRDPAWRHHLLVSDPRPPPRASGLVVVGDSVPHGTHALDDGQDGLPLSVRLSVLLGGVSAIDRSVPGERADRLNAVLPGRLDRLSLRPHWCLVWSGHNDAYFGRSADDILFDLSGCVFKARTAGMRPLVVGPIPVADAPGRNRSAQEATLAELDRKLERFCASARVTFVSARDGLSAGSPPPGGWLVAKDGNHLSDAGLDLVADLCAKAIRAADARPSPNLSER